MNKTKTIMYRFFCIEWNNIDSFLIYIYQGYKAVNLFYIFLKVYGKAISTSIENARCFIYVCMLIQIDRKKKVCFLEKLHKYNETKLFSKITK